MADTTDTSSNSTPDSPSSGEPESTPTDTNAPADTNESASAPATEDQVAEQAPSQPENPSLQTLATSIGFPGISEKILPWILPCGCALAGLFLGKPLLSSIPGMESTKEKSSGLTSVFTAIGGALLGILLNRNTWVLQSGIKSVKNWIAPQQQTPSQDQNQP